MDEHEFPTWAWPTRDAQKLHYFPEVGEPSLCRRYIATMPALMNFPNPGASNAPSEKGCCAACWRKAPADVEIQRQP